MRHIRLFPCVILSLWVATSAAAYEPGTHEAIATRAAQPHISSLDLVLKGELGIAGGILEVLPRHQARIEQLIGEGASAEDIPKRRSLHHFHNPLLPWTSAGLHVGAQIGQSAIVWQQSPDQANSLVGGGSWSWPDARARFWSALTGAGLPDSSKSHRDGALADTFLTLGHLVHLVQDVTVPAHTRNDQHLVLEGLEAWAEQARLDRPPGEQALFRGYLTQAQVMPPPTIFTPGLPEAPVPIARLIDGDQLAGPDTAGVLTDPRLGIAEYTSGNFLSDDTIFVPGFSLPRPQSLDLSSPILEPVGARFRRHFSKVADGEQILHFVAESALHRSVAAALGHPVTGAFTLTRRVYRDYAAALLPRAVGYSAALLDYFFRGRLAASGDSLSAGFANLGSEPMDGTLSLYYDAADDKRYGVPDAVWRATLAPGGFVGDLRFRAPSNPPPREPGKYMLAFRGVLGHEADAVIGKEVFIPSAIEVRLVKRSDGTPYPGSLVKTIDVDTREELASATTDPDGIAKLLWKPGKTALFMVRQFPVYWAGEGAFASSLESARVLQATDVDHEGRLTVPIPLIAAEWPDREDACTGYPVFTNFRNATQQDTFLLDGSRILYVVAFYGVSRIAFTRTGTATEVVVCDVGTFCASGVDHLLVAEDLNRVGQVIGELVRDVSSVHSRQIFTMEDGAVGDLLETLCVQYHGEVETLPVTLGER